MGSKRGQVEVCTAEGNFFPIEKLCRSSDFLSDPMYYRLPPAADCGVRTMILEPGLELGEYEIPASKMPAIGAPRTPRPAPGASTR